MLFYQGKKTFLFLSNSFAKFALTTQLKHETK